MVVKEITMRFSVNEFFDKDLEKADRAIDEVENRINKWIDDDVKTIAINNVNILGDKLNLSIRTEWDSEIGFSVNDGSKERALFFVNKNKDVLVSKTKGIVIITVR